MLLDIPVGMHIKDQTSIMINHNHDQSQSIIIMTNHNHDQSQS